MAETVPLLDGEVRKRTNYSSLSTSVEQEGADVSIEPADTVKLKRHIRLHHAVAIMVGNVIGSGIFVSPKGVTSNIGSVGASLIVWGMTGFYNLAQALCYAELGAVIPRAGGDYAYMYEILGPMPAFMCAWVHVVVIASSSCAVIARTAGLYLVRPFDVDCNLNIITLIAIWIIGKSNWLFNSFA